MKNSITTKHAVFMKYFKGIKTFQFTIALFLAGIGLLGQFSLNAQNSMVFVNPSHSGGYLAWLDGGDSIRYWRIEVKERIALTDSTFGTRVIWRHEEWRQHFIQIPLEYRQKNISNKYGIDLIGLNASHNIIAIDEVVPLVPDLDWTVWVEGCKKVCNGPDYAWKVQQLIPVGEGGHKYELMEAGFNSGNPYWQYMTLDEYDFLKYNLLPYFMEYYDIQYNYVISEPDHLIKTLPNHQDITYHDSQGNGISHLYHDEIKAVRKAMGPWNQVSHNESFTSHLSGDPHGSGSLCVNNTLQYAMAVMNTYADFEPELVCEQQAYSIPSTGDSNYDWEDCDHLFDELDLETPEILEDTIGGHQLTDAINEWIDAWYDCTELNLPDDDGDGGSTDGGGWGNIIEFSLSIVKGDGMLAVLNKKANELFDENGVFVPFSANLDPGLYYMYAVNSKSGQIIPDKFFELKNPVQISFNLSHFFNFTVFPVPHIEDQFNMNMQALSDLNIRYELYDFQGNLVHRAQYQLKQGHNEDHLILPANPIPPGLLINRFTFDDGSVKTLTTIRQ